MSKARIALYTISVVVFVATFIPWLRFLEIDRCMDLGGGFEDGVCTAGASQAITFWNSNLWFKAFAVLPPVVATLAVFSFVRFTFVRDDVPPNKSLERTREG